ncbi:MAG: hydroxyacylglutathione hydrolase [Gammaproteobacteria bacterium]|nr:hydroxyacylglutathione hydrolase [Gammaproteobacteria bacterium]
MTIYPIPIFKDNYIWILVDDACKKAVIVDPGDARPVFDFLNQKNITPIAILLTHKHTDHTGGIGELYARYPFIKVYASQADEVAFTSDIISEKNTISFSEFKEDFIVIDIPGHTLGHVAYYCKPHLFCGDTLFGAGCGRIFEGTPTQMFSSLRKLMALPDDTLIYCGHEYTVTNLEFALTVEPGNTDMQKRLNDAIELRSQNKPTLPSTIALEKKTNPFFRFNEPVAIQAVLKKAGRKLNTEVDIFYAMRKWKNEF